MNVNQPGREGGIPKHTQSMHGIVRRVQGGREGVRERDVGASEALLVPFGRTMDGAWEPKF